MRLQALQLAEGLGQELLADVAERVLAARAPVTQQVMDALHVTLAPHGRISSLV
jgi:hypothetical protein